MPLIVELVNVTRHFGAAAVLSGVSLHLEPGCVTGLLGNSGSGKTTLLRIVAGLDHATTGEVRVSFADGRQPRAKPAIGMLFQNLALWPHLTARQHLEYVLASVPRSERRRRVEARLAEVALPTSSWDRLPSQLSGGEGQRLALARALAIEPDLLLLDEPLAHLDASLRGDMLALLQRLIVDRGVTTWYVTHHAAEAFELCRTLIVLDRGVVAQQGSPQRLFWSPCDRTVARLTGPCLELPAAWFEDGTVRSDPQHALCRGLIDADVILFRPQQIRLDFVDDAPWQVGCCLPQDSGWMAVIKGPQGRSLRVPTSASMAVGQRVAVRCIPTPDVIESIVHKGDGR